MLSNPLESSSLPKREVRKCFKSSSHITLQVFAWNHAKFSQNFREIESLPFSSLFQNSAVPTVQERNSIHVTENIANRR